MSLWDLSLLASIFMTAIKEEATGTSWIKLIHWHRYKICLLYGNIPCTVKDVMTTWTAYAPRSRYPWNCQSLFLNTFVSCHVDNTKTPSQLQPWRHMKSEESWLHLLTTWYLPTGYYSASHSNFYLPMGDLFIFSLCPPVSHSPWRW